MATNTCVFIVYLYWPCFFQEFVVQHSENANPPTFFLTLETLIQQMQREDKMVAADRHTWHCPLPACSRGFVCDSSEPCFWSFTLFCLQDLVFLRHIYPRLEAWYEWFNVTQVQGHSYQLSHRSLTQISNAHISCIFVAIPVHRLVRNHSPIDGEVEMTPRIGNLTPK